MAEVTVSGTFDGEQMSLSWTDGEVSGSPVLRAALDFAVSAGGEVALTPVGPWYRRGTTSAWQFVATVSDLVTDLKWEGDLPALAALPAGAVS